MEENGEKVRMFLGNYSAQINDGSRLSLPKKIREQIVGIEIIVAKGFDGCIFGYQKSTWEEMAKEELIKPVSTLEGRKIRRQLFEAAESVGIDDQGRVVLSQNLKKYADLGKSVTVIGAGDHFEIWDKNKWEEYSKQL